MSPTLPQNTTLSFVWFLCRYRTVYPAFSILKSFLSFRAVLDLQEKKNQWMVQSLLLSPVATHEAFSCPPPSPTQEALCATQVPTRAVYLWPLANLSITDNSSKACSFHQGSLLVSRVPRVQTKAPQPCVYHLTSPKVVALA